MDFLDLATSKNPFKVVPTHMGGPGFDRPLTKDTSSLDV